MTSTLGLIVVVIPTTVMLLGMWVAWLALEFAHDGGDITSRCPAPAANRRQLHTGYARTWTADPPRIETLRTMWQPAVRTHRAMGAALAVHAMGTSEVQRVAA